MGTLLADQQRRGRSSNHSIYDRKQIGYALEDLQTTRIAISDSILVPYSQWLDQIGQVQSSEEPVNAVVSNQLFQLTSVEHRRLKKLRTDHSGEEKVSRASLKLSKVFADDAMDNNADASHHVSSKTFARGLRCNAMPLRKSFRKQWVLE